MRLLTHSCLMAFVIVASGCATMERATQKLTVFTDPPGASCTLATEGEAQSWNIATTPGTVEVALYPKPLMVSCVKRGYLDVAEQFADISRKEAYDAEREGLVAGSAAAHLSEQQMKVGGTAEDPSEQQKKIAAGVTGAVAVTGAAAGAVAATTGATGGLLVAGTLGTVGTVLPLVGVVLLVPFAVHGAATGSIYGYPPAIALILTPENFPDAGSRDAYFRKLDDRIVLVGQERLRQEAKECRPSKCARRLSAIDADVAEQRQRIALLKDRTRVAPGGAALVPATEVKPPAAAVAEASARAGPNEPGSAGGQPQVK